MFRIATAILAAVSFAACRSTGESPLVLDSDIWVALNDPDSTGRMNPERNHPLPSIEFLNDGRLTGHTSCNSFFGSYTTRKTDSVSQIEITIDGMTLALCPNSEWEQEYIEKLKKTCGYMVRDRQLLLLDSTGTAILMFVPASTTQKKQ